MTRIALAIIACVAVAQMAVARDVRITDGAASVQFMINARQYMIERNQDTSAVITGEFARVARPCPGECIVPHSADPQILNVSELEIMEFLRRTVSNDLGLLVDARAATDYGYAHIPAAINIPGAALSPDNPYRDEIFIALGGQKVGGNWNFSAQSKTLLFYAGGAWDDAAITALQSLLTAGYPARKLAFYRGGMQSWLMLGLSTQSYSNQ